MPTPLAERLRENLGRVRSLVAAYRAAVGPRQGRPNVQQSDILRAAVVLLHAGLEDTLRTVAAERLPVAVPGVLSRIPFSWQGGRKTTATLGDLSAYRNLSVADLIVEAVDAFLDRATYNNVTEIAGLLGDIGLSPALVIPFASEIEALMRRRHQIVHRMDRDEAIGPGRHGAFSLSVTLVESWIGAVSGFGLALDQATQSP